MLASREVHLLLALAVGLATIYGSLSLSAWLLVPGAVLVLLLIVSATDLIEYLAIHHALRQTEADARFAELVGEADRLVDEGMPEEAEEAYMEAAEHRWDRATVIAQYMQLARRCRETRDYAGARKWLSRAKRLTRPE
jgi:hypothetical protein